MKVLFFALALIVAEPHEGTALYRANVGHFETLGRCYEMGALVGGTMVSAYRIDPEGPRYDITCRPVVLDLGGA